MEQAQKMPANGILIGFQIDAAKVVGIVVPVKQYGAQTGQQPVGQVTGAFYGMVSASGNTVPNAETPVRRTSIG